MPAVIDLLDLDTMPEKHKRDDKAVKIERRIAAKAKLIAEARGISVAEYISELLRPLVDRDFPKAVKQIDTRPTEE